MTAPASTDGAGTPPLFLLPRSLRHDGKPCRDYTIRDGGGALRYVARAFRVPGPIVVRAASAPDVPILHGTPRRSFPLTGRYDVHDAVRGDALGVVTRSGRFHDARGRQLGRFADARSWKAHLAEGALSAVVEGVILGQDGAAIGAGPRAYELTLGGVRAGTLARARLPFEVEPEPAAPPAPLAQALRRLLPRRAGEALLDPRPTHAWKLEVADRGAVPEGLLLVATLLAVEMALW